MKKVVNLSVHRNTREKRRARAVVREMDGLGRAARDEIGSVDGYVLVAWNGDREAVVYWSHGSLPQSCLPEFAAESIRRTAHMMDVRRMLDMENDDE